MTSEEAGGPGEPGSGTGITDATGPRASRLGRAARWAAAALLATVLSVALVTLLRTPSLSRSWDEDVRVLAGVDMADGRVALTRIRDWSYAGPDITHRTYFDQSFDPADIRDLWMYEQILDGRGLIAHTFLVFEFDESYGPARFLGLSVETRREVGETYSLVGGMLRSFEVTHIWATERDLVRRRVQHLDYPLTRYRLVVPPEVRGRIFEKMALETAELATTPRWYHTALNNCTSSLIRYVNESEPGAIPWHYSRVATGRADEHLARMGYLDAASAEYIDRTFLAERPLR